MSSFAKVMNPNGGGLPNVASSIMFGMTKVAFKFGPSYNLILYPAIAHSPVAQ